MNSPRVTVVIPTWQAREDIRECLLSLQRQSFRDFTVLVVDGGSPDGTADVARELGARVVIEREPTRAAACATALQHVDSEYVAFTDADCEPDADWLEVLVERLDAAPANYAAIGGPNVSPDSDSELGKAVDVVFASRVMSGGTRYGFVSDGDVDIDHNPGCNVMYRADAVKSVGFEGFPTAEDVVLDHSLRVAGWRLLFTPHAIVRHKRRGTVRSFAKQIRRYGKGRALAARKYPQLWQPVYPLPSSGLLAAVSLMALGVWEVFALGHAHLLALLAAFTFAYAGVVALDVAASHSPHLDTRRGLAAVPLILLAQAAWGIGYAHGAITHHATSRANARVVARDVTFISGTTATALLVVIVLA